MNLSIKTAKESGLALCPKCHKLNDMQQSFGNNAQIQCIRCHGMFYSRKPYSLQFTLAWNVAALLAFIPANIAW